MDVLTSSEFRKRYGKLTRDTRVTVNGHVIGTWSPAGVYMSLAKIKADVLVSAQQVIAERTPEFRPAPKPSQKGK